MGNLRLVEIVRGVADPEGVASLLGGVFDVEPEAGEDGAVRLRCANGVLTFHGDVSTPVSVTLAGASADATDPDGVTLRAARTSEADAGGRGPSVDHVALQCDDLGVSTTFYEQLGFEETYADPGECVHVSGADGYLSLQHDAGPAGFLHLGVAVEDLAEIAERLTRRGISFLRAPSSPVGERLYFHDGDGDRARAGHNVEVVQYRDGEPRSGRSL